MSTSLLNIVGKLSEINKQKKKKNATDTWKEKKIRSECNFIRSKNNKLHYKCKVCTKKRWLKPVYGLIKKVFKCVSILQG